MKKTINTESIQLALSENGMTQKQLAVSVGVSSQAVTNWLKGNDFPRPATLLKLASTLKLTFDQMVKTSDSGRPVIAFRKKGSAKTTNAHIAKAEEIGMLLKPLVPFLSEIQSLRMLITSPSIEYNKIQITGKQIRAHLGIGEHAVLEYEHLISEFKNCGAVLVPVLLGAKGNHENALHIRLPEEDVTFIFLNLDTRLEDFKFWMAHELAHVYTPDLAGKTEGEDFADAFAGAILFPRSCAQEAYNEAISQDYSGHVRVLQKYAKHHVISLNTVYHQINAFAKNSNLPVLNIEEKIIHEIRNGSPGSNISEMIFDPMPPASNQYIAASEHLFGSDFFNALKRMIHEKHTGASYLQQILDLSIYDAKALYEELWH